MKRNLIRENIWMVQDELSIGGFPKSTARAAVREILRRTGRDFRIPFKVTVGGMPVSGSVHFEGSLPNGYRLSHFMVTLESPGETHIRENGFVCTPGYEVNLEEAVNLMERRYVYRSPALDPLGEGYWIHLDRPGTYSGYYIFGYTRNGFRIEESAGVAPGLLDEKMIMRLRRGDRVEISSQLGKAVIEADPVGKRLKVSDWWGMDVSREGWKGLCRN